MTHPENFNSLSLNHDGNPVHYIPHHAVIRRERATTKIRIVYDGSAKLGNSELSINECLQTGPNLVPNLFDVLVRFRSHRIAVTADIEKAFLMIGIIPADRDVLRFLWLKDPTKLNSPVLHFRFTRVVFGLRPSPAILSAVILHHLNKYTCKHPKLVEQIRTGLYVDDLVTGNDSVDSAFQTYSISKQIMKEAGLNLRKWKTNSSELLSLIEEKESNQDTQSNKPKLPVVEEEQSYAQSSTSLLKPEVNELYNKLLGVMWDNQSDEFVVDLSELSNYVKGLPETKRSVLRVSARIFDPLGLVSPLVIRLKLLFRSLCTNNVNWDDSIEGEALSKWRSLIAEFSCVNQLKVPRCYFRSSFKPILIELHGFSDASAQAYGAVVYLRAVYKDGSISSTIIASKTRVAPLKVQTIPRLELLAAVILVRLVSTLKGSLEALPNLATYYWTDSTVVLYWIRNKKSWRQYVSNRVNEIKRYSMPEEWNHCPGLLNPADMPSRGLTGAELGENQVWWNGPEFLFLPKSDWPNSHELDDTREAESELIKEAPVILHTFAITGGRTTPYKLQHIIDCNRFSLLNKLLRTTAYVIRFVKKLLNKINPRSHLTSQCEVDSSSLPTVEEINEAEEYWIKSIQGESFIAEIRYLTTDKPVGTPVRINQFGLFLEQGVLKCRGRLNNSTLALSSKNPILLPHSHPFVKLLILQYHARVNHSGVNDTLTLLRETYWILKGKRIVKQSIKDCVKCLKCEGLPYSVSTTPDLPVERVSDDPPFTHLGIDFAGPLYIQTHNSSDENKAYICLFTCASTRAIYLTHLQLIHSF